MASSASYEAMVTPKPPLDLNIPKSNSTVKVSIIDTTVAMTIPIGFMCQPDVGGFKSITCPAYSFLIEHPINGEKLLFDLGVRKDWINMAPWTVHSIQKAGMAITIQKDVRDILESQCVDVAGGAINGIVWSHYHFDHTGDPSRFPGSTKLIVGPGFKRRFPKEKTWPSKQDSPLREDMWSGRELVEVGDEMFEKSGLKIGRFRAVDWWGDGSFYLLDTPGHLLAHLCALARTTAEGEESFIFMGGDVAHHGGELRPSAYLPLPKSLSLDGIKGVSFPSPCPGEILQHIHPKKSPTEHFYEAADGFNEDKDLATWTVEGVTEFDGHDEVLVVIAHDHTLLDILDMYPNSANDWRKKMLNRKGRWRFIADFSKGIEQAARGSGKL